MISIPQADIPDVWKHFLIDLEFARNYSLAYIDLPGPAPKNPVLEKLLPSLLHIKAVAILDHAFGAWIDSQGLNVPKKTYGEGKTLNGKIEFLADSGVLADRQTLLSMKDTRNDLGHEPAAVIDWNQLARDVVTIHATLRELKLVDQMPQFEIFSERSEPIASQDPNVILTTNYRIAITQSGKLVEEIKWSNNLLRDDS